MGVVNCFGKVTRMHSLREVSEEDDCVYGQKKKMIMYMVTK